MGWRKRSGKWEGTLKIEREIKIWRGNRKQNGRQLENLLCPQCIHLFICGLIEIYVLASAKNTVHEEFKQNKNAFRLLFFFSKSVNFTLVQNLADHRKWNLGVPLQLKNEFYQFGTYFRHTVFTSVNVGLLVSVLKLAKLRTILYSRGCCSLFHNVSDKK